MTWGELDDGRQVHAHTIGSDGLSLTVLEWGATVQTLVVGGRNVVLGHPDLETYLASPYYLGATIGRYCNRIRDGRFTVDGVPYEVPRNDRGNNLHGGPAGFDRQLWEVRSADSSYAEFGLVSPTGHQGFPGELSVRVRFTVTGTRVRIDYEATTDAPTPIGLTNHSYFNLDGEAAGRITDHVLRIDGDSYTPLDPTGIPTGEVEPVDDSAFDWRVPSLLDRLDASELDETDGLDHNFAVNGSGFRPVAELTSTDRTLTLTVASDQPGIQVYSGNKLDGSLPGTSGTAYQRRGGIALETQPFPDSPNQPAFGDVILRPGAVHRSRTEWRFSAG